MRNFGLIGFPLSHSFSKKYFSNKFTEEGISDSGYDLFEMKDVSTELPSLIRSDSNLIGLNVTIPHKQAVIPLLHEIDPVAKAIGAVNVIKIANGKLKGFNSDYYGFKVSLERMLDSVKPIKALVLGTGGASKAVVKALQDMNIEANYVSRSQSDQVKFTYDMVDQAVIQDHQLIINTTPLGMSPNTDSCPDLPYDAISGNHFLYDLVYNPSTTLFMKKGISQGAKTKNGLEMLELQAEKSWEIWNDL